MHPYSVILLRLSRVKYFETLPLMSLSAVESCSVE